MLIAILKKLGSYNIIGYTDQISRGPILGVSYRGDDSFCSDAREKYGVNNVVVGIGDSAIRYRIVSRLEQRSFSFPTIISTDALIQEGVNIGHGTVVMDGAVVNTGTTIGCFSIINTSSSVDHDCRISDYVHIAPGATLCGGVSVCAHAWVGAGATVIQNKTIAANSFVGAGAVVVNDCICQGIYIGVPARKVMAGEKT